MAIGPPAHSRNAGSSDSWITPEWLIQEIGPFDLDPCAATPQPWPCAALSYTVADNGLARPWHGTVYCNPPYGKTLGAWLRLCSQHGDAVALTFARTETRAFFKYVWPTASVLLFLRGRVTFLRPDGTPSRNGGNSGGPSVLIAWGNRAAARLVAAGHLGQVVIPQRCPLRKGLFD